MSETTSTIKELIHWREYRANIDKAMMFTRKACGHLDKARFINEMKLYDDMTFSDPPLKIQHALELLNSHLLQLRNQASNIIQSSTGSGNK